MDNIKVTLDDGNNLRLDLPITKVDEENRLVSGFATLDNLDKHGDVIDSSASQKAFKQFEARGNIREMHMPVAVGKMVKFEEKEHVEKDEDGDKTYNGIYVTARVSKGAETTWQKVLDGTLSGFSIGAVVKEKENVYKDDGSHYRVIKDYELFELSLVDSPANPLANVVSIMKVADGEIAVSGVALDEDLEEKHYDPSSLEGKVSRIRQAFYKEAQLSEDEYVVDIYDNFVLTQHGDKQYKVSYSVLDGDVVFGARSEVETEVTITEKSDKEVSAVEKFFNTVTELLEKRIGGNNMADKNEKVEEVVEKTADEVAEETVEKAEEISEVEVDETATDEDTSVDVDSIVKSVVEKVLERLSEASVKTDNEVVTEEAAPEADGDTEVVDDEVAKSINDLAETVKTAVDAISSRVKALEDSSAVKKSVDADRNDDDDEDVTQKSVWAGAFSGDLSVDSL